MIPANAIRGLTSYLVRRDEESNCTNDGAQATQANVGGSVTVFFVDKHKALAVVRLTDVSPGTLYRFDQKCIRKLGNVKSDLSGKGVGTFEFFPRRSRGIAFIMASRGEPEGDRYQSVPLAF